MTLFKEYKKKSISDPRQTFEAIVNNKLQGFDMDTNSMNKSDIDQQRIDFLLDVSPFIREYYEEDNEDECVDETSSTVKKHDLNPSNMKHYVLAQHGTNKKGVVYEKYMKHIGESNIPEYNKVDSICFKCNMLKLFDTNESSSICPGCGEQKYSMDSQLYNNVNNYQYTNGNEPQSEVTPFYAYKRSNHFSEWLSQLQGKETTFIPESVYESLMKELKKERIYNINDITHAKIRSYLKKLRLNKYYEHIPHIIQKLKGISPPKIKPEIEETLRQMFYLIQEPFRLHCPKNRKNFLSYSYTLYKMSEILGEDDMLEQFTLPLLKSRDKLTVQDQIWKGICSELNWEFIPTI